MSSRPLPSSPPRDQEMSEVYLDDSDHLVARVPKSTTDPGFRRGMYVFLLVLGLLAAMSLIQARRNQQDLQEARRAQAVAERQVSLLIQEQQMARAEATQRAAKAERDRAALAARSAGLERLIISVLANSTDPALRTSFRQFAKSTGISTRVLITRGIVSRPRAGPVGGTHPRSAPAPVLHRRARRGPIHRIAPRRFTHHGRSHSHGQVQHHGKSGHHKKHKK